MAAGAGPMGALEMSALEMSANSKLEENPSETPTPSTESGLENPQDSFAPRPGETDEEFFARKDAEGAAEFAAAVQAWRDERAKGGGQAKIVKAQGGFSTGSQDGNAGKASAGQ